MHIKRSRQVLEKTPSEIRIVVLDWTDDEVFGTGEIFTGTPSTSSTPTGLTISNASVSDQQIQIKITGGTANTDYQVNVTSGTTNNQTLEGELLVRVRA